MRRELMLAATVLLVSPGASHGQGGCGWVYAGYPLQAAVAFALDGPRIEERGPMVLAGLEDSVAGTTVDMQIDVLWTKFEQRNQWILNEESDARTGVCFNGGAQGGFDYFAGQVLDGPAQDLPDNLTTLDLAGGRYAVFTLTGQATDVVAAQSEIYHGRLAEADLKAADAPDLLVFPPGFSPAKRDQKIELWVPLVP